MHFLKNDIVMHSLEWIVINQLITKPPHCRLKSRRELAALEGVFILASSIILVRFGNEFKGIIEFNSVYDDKHSSLQTTFIRIMLSALSKNAKRMRHFI